MDHNDSYRLLSYKALSAFYWITKNCKDVPWTIHSDDDTLIDVFCLAKELQKLSVEVTSNSFLCTFMGGAVLRTGRWRVEEADYPAARYPQYCSGGVWTIKTELLPRLLNASQIAPFVWVDDAYITGILRQSAGMVRYSMNGKYSHKMNMTKHLGIKYAWLYPGPQREDGWSVLLDHHRNTSHQFYWDRNPKSQSQIEY